MKKELNKRILSVVLAFVTVFSLLPPFALAVETDEAQQTAESQQTPTETPVEQTEDNVSFAITYEGETVTEVAFFEYERITVSAETVTDGSYQWQILIPDTEQWIDIQGQEGQSIHLSKAVVGSLLVDGSAYVRCVISCEGAEIGYTEPLRVTVKAAEQAAIAEMLAAATPAALEAEEAAAEEAVPAETTAGESAAEEPTEESIPEETAGEPAPEETAEAADTYVGKYVRSLAPVALAEEASEETENTEDADGTESEQSEDDTSKTVSVVINYVYWDRITDKAGEKTWNSYEARIPAGSAFNEKILNKTIPGYKVSWKDGTHTNASLVTPVTKEDETKDWIEYDPSKHTTSYVSIDIDSVTENVIYTVYYEEVMVPYYARYYLQNVYNDLYVEDTAMSSGAVFEGYQNADPQLYDVVDENGNVVKKGIYQEKYGFTALFHQPDKIAADGSTVFEVYYDRNYYLINFDMGGGYGTAPVYARFETSFTVSLPTKAGNTFNGWVEDETARDINTDGSDVADTEFVTALTAHIATIPTTAHGRVTKIPFSNMTYKAQWTPQQVPYTVAYWIADGSTKNFIGNLTAYADSGDEVNGETHKDTSALANLIVCGAQEHTHEASCYSCNKTEHTHHQAHDKDDCYSFVSWKDEVNSSSNDAGVIAAANANLTDTTGTYIYVIWTSSDTRLWPKVLIDGKYYTVYIDEQDTVSDDRLKAITGETGTIRDNPDGTYKPSGDQRTYYVKKYLLNADCGMTICEAGCATIEHTHKDTCYACKFEEHTHTDNCKYHLAHTLTFLKDQTDKNVTISGDGSTVVNVVYGYKNYTMRYYYARSTVVDGATVYSVVGGSTYKFGALGGVNDSVTTLLGNVGNDQWGSVKALPTIKDAYKDRYTTGSIPGNGYTYYYLEYTAKFGSVLENLWPVDIFEPVELSKETDQCPGLKNAYFSAWNGECKVKYSQDHKDGNQTIKGLYMYLDEDVVYDSKYTEDPITDANGQVSYLVNFLGFWDNGASGDGVSWSVPKEFHYHIMIPTTETTDTVEYPIGSGSYYKVYKNFTVYDNSDLKATENQTAVAMAGYDHIATVVENVDGYYNYDTGDLQSVDYYFYYSKSRHNLFFWNYNGYLEDGQGVNDGVTYGTSLKMYETYVTDPDYIKTKYPSGLEPDVYEFQGWYTATVFTEDTEVNWDTLTMPDSDMTLYARWTPKTYDTYFYIDYDHYLSRKNEDGELDTTKVYTTITGTPHGESMTLGNQMNDILYPEHPTGTGYRFTGWFYIDTDGEKTAFNPAEMAVRKELHLYAEWASSTSLSYTIHYVLGDQDGNIVKDKNDNPYKVADDTVGYGFEASTRTFDAKSGDQLNRLGEIDQTVLNQYIGGLNGNEVLWLPNTGSHSILLKPVKDDGTNPNEFTFIYMAKKYAPYTVKYLDATTGTELIEAVTYRENQKAVVTEQFKYVPGYIPDAFYKTMTLSAVDSENVIIFYYMEDEDAEEGEGGETPVNKNQMYYVSHWVQDEDGTDDYFEYTASSDIGEIGTTISVTPLQIQGFTFSEVKTKAEMGEANVTGNATDGWTVNGTVTSGAEGSPALELKLYYTRNTYYYKIQYLERGTGTPLIYDGENGNKDQYPDAVLEGTDYYQKKITQKAPTITGYEVYLAEDNTTGELSLVIGEDEEKNVLTFYYTKIPVTINYHTVLQDVQADKYCELSRTSEIYETGSTITGAWVKPETGFEFLGWYKDADGDEEITDKAWFKTDDSSHLVPQVNADDNVDTYHYYAIFKPITKSITIKNNAAVDTDLGTDTFLYRISGTDVVGNTIDLVVSIQGANSVTVNLYYPQESTDGANDGSYTVEQIDSWSWAYSCTPPVNTTVSFVDDEPYEVTFTNAPKGVCWLHGESEAKENQF